MPDHRSQPRNSPPDFFDLIRGNSLTLGISSLSFGVGTIVIGDVLTDDRWDASYVLQYVPNLFQAVMSVLLLLGALWTAYGALIRSSPFTKRPICLVKTITTERIGWTAMVFGWLTILIPMVEYARPGSTLSLFIMFMIMMCCLVRACQLYLLGRSARAEMAKKRKVDKELKYLRGESD